MNTKYYHTPPKPESTRARCPVCHESVYSRAGIHPQCAVRRSDPPRPKEKKVDPESVGPVVIDMLAEIGAAADPVVLPTTV